MDFVNFQCVEISSHFAILFSIIPFIFFMMACSKVRQNAC